MLEQFPSLAPIVAQISSLIDSFGNTLKQENESSNLWTILGYLYLNLGDFPNAFASYAHALRVTPESQDPIFWYSMGIVYAHYKYNEYALNCLLKVLSLDKKITFINDVKFRLGIIYRAQQIYDESIKYFTQIVKAPPNDLVDSDIQMQIAYTYQMQGLGEKALHIYKNLHTKYPKSLKVTQQYCIFSFLHATDSEIPAVKELIHKALIEFPNDPTLLLITARIAMKQDDMATAYQNYRFCITYCSDSPYFWCGLGVLYHKNDQTQDAVVAFQRALYLKSDMPEAWLNIGYIFEQQNDFTDSMKIYTTGSQKCPNNAVFQERLATLGSQKSGHRKFISNYKLVDIDDSNFFVPVSEQFANDYIAAVPQLPYQCFNIGEAAKNFKLLSTFPKSLFI